MPHFMCATPRATRALRTPGNAPVENVGAATKMERNFHTVDGRNPAPLGTWNV